MNIDKLIKKQLRMLSEGSDSPQENYMFFGNLKQMHRQCELLMNEDKDKLDSILKEHDWAQDHIAEAKSLLDQVFDFLMNETKSHDDNNMDNDSFGSELNETKHLDESKNKPTNPKLWARAKSMAKSKFKVYPSAYANGWAAKWYKKHGGGWKKSK
jgi:hypothetical protein